MATDKNLKKVHLFSSETQYDNNKSSLDSTEELALIPIEKLVKYERYTGSSGKADEFQDQLSTSRVAIQYGTYIRDGSVQTITFPVAFASAQSYNFYLKYDNDNFGELPYTTSDTSDRGATFIKIDTANGSGEKGEWLAIGHTD